MGLLPWARGEHAGWLGQSCEAPDGRRELQEPVRGGPVLVGVLLQRPVIGLPAAGLGMALLAGGCVGLGTGLAHGCTSGHGVCGLSRLSPRSLAATAAFMGAGFATVYVIRHLSGI